MSKLSRAKSRRHKNGRVKIALRQAARKELGFTSRYSYAQAVSERRARGQDNDWKGFL